MKLSTRCRYGLRSLADLAIHSHAGHVALYQVAERQKLSLKYLEQDFAALRKAGFVRSVKGAQGGYVLARDPAKIKVSEIVSVLEGDLVAIEPQVGGGAVTPIRQCLNETVWLPLNQKIRESLENLTLADLIRQYEAEQPSEPMYFI